MPDADVSEVERLEAGRKFMSDDSKALVRGAGRAQLTNKNTKAILCTLLC